MSYDPFDEETETILNDIVNAFNKCPKRTQKMIFAEIFDRLSSLKILLQENNVMGGEDLLLNVLQEKYDKVEKERLVEAKILLYKLMSLELP